MHPELNVHAAPFSDVWCDLRRDQFELVEVVEVDDLEVGRLRARGCPRVEAIDDLGDRPARTTRSHLVGVTADRGRAPAELGNVCTDAGFGGERVAQRRGIATRGLTRGVYTLRTRAESRRVA